MKRKMLYLMLIGISTGTVVLAAEPEQDTTFKRSNPSLLYTTRDFYIDLPEDCYNNALCLRDFYLVVTFNVGMDGKQTVQQIGFKQADLEFFTKTPGEKNYLKQTFTDYHYTAQMDGWKVNVVFEPDKTGTTMPLVKQFVFDGTVDQQQLSGMLTFYLKSGGLINVAIN